MHLECTSIVTASGIWAAIQPQSHCNVVCEMVAILSRGRWVNFPCEIGRWWQNDPERMCQEYRFKLHLFKISQFRNSSTLYGFNIKWETDIYWWIRKHLKNADHTDDMMSLHKTVVTPVLMHWSYHSLVLSHGHFSVMKTQFICFYGFGCDIYFNTHLQIFQHFRVIQLASSLFSSPRFKLTIS